MQKSKMAPVSVIVRVETASKTVNNNARKHAKPGKRTKTQGQAENLMNFNFKPPELQSFPEMQERPSASS